MECGNKRFKCQNAYLRQFGRNLSRLVEVPVKSLTEKCFWVLAGLCMARNDPVAIEALFMIFVTIQEVIRQLIGNTNRRCGR